MGELEVVTVDGELVPRDEVTLEECAEIINDEFELMQKDAASAAARVLRIGNTLMAAKAGCQHGEWIPWVEENCPFDRTGASRYMKIAKSGNDARVQHLGINRAIKLLSDSTTTKPAGAPTGEYEWYTPAEYVEMARLVLGGIDLDPASCAAANKVVQAKAYYSQERDQDGLALPWQGRVFCNPPYKMPDVASFAEKMRVAYAAKDIEGILLVNNCTDSDWWQLSAKASPSLCFTDGRVPFYSPRSGSQKMQTRQGQTFFYFGANAKMFRQVFSDIGVVMREVKR